jgi:hypothetical protein
MAEQVESKGGLEPVRQSLYAVINAVYPMLLNGESAIAAVVKGCELLENDPRFNAGTGSVLQSDGQIRMSASIMDGDQQSFSGYQISLTSSSYVLKNKTRFGMGFGAAPQLRASPSNSLNSSRFLDVIRNISYEKAIHFFSVFIVVFYSFA